MSKSIKTIAVDLTPVLPGGENGGAKIFVLELLRQLAAMAPNTQFVLLTQAASHAELAKMDGMNIRRRMVIGARTPGGLRPQLVRVGVRLMRHFPARLRGFAIRIGYRINTALRWSSSGTLLRDMGADLLFCPFTAPTFFEADIPTVCTIYDLQYKTYPEFFTPEDVAHRNRTFIEACRRSSRLAAISDYSRDSAITHGAIDALKIRTIHLRMAQRVNAAAGQDATVLPRLGLTAKRYLVYPANFWKHKNHEMLLTAFGMACNGGMPTDIKLVCTGAPGMRQSWLREAASKMGLDGRVLFPGYLPNSELAAVIGQCRGVVFPSLYEGFGLPVIEAMAAGVPVACSNSTSLPEVAACAAIAFDPRVPTEIAAAIRQLVEDDAECARLVEAGWIRAEEFADSQRMAREYWELFQDARANLRSQDSLTGFHADGWAGPVLNLQVTSSTGVQTLDISMFAPDWLPHTRLTLQAVHNGRPEGKAMYLVRGANGTWSVPLAASGGYYEIRLSPAFIPAKLGMGADSRELTAMLERCAIARTDGTGVELFPEKATA